MSKFVATKKSIQNIYNTYNQLLFKDELPLIPISIGKAKHSAASVSFTVIRNRFRHIDPNSIEICKLTYSNFYDRDVESVHGVIIHEMIHIWLAVNGQVETSGKDKSHGIEFTDKLAELQHRVNFKIPLTEDSSEHTISNPKTKERGVVIIKRKDGKESIVIISDKLIQDITTLHEYFSKLFDINPFTSIIVGKSINPELARYPQKRVLRNLSIYAKIDGLENLEYEMNKLFTIS